MDRLFKWIVYNQSLSFSKKEFIEHKLCKQHLIFFFSISVTFLLISIVWKLDPEINKIRLVRVIKMMDIHLLKDLILLTGIQLLDNKTNPSGHKTATKLSMKFKIDWKGYNSTFFNLKSFIP